MKFLIFVFLIFAVIWFVSKVFGTIFRAFTPAGESSQGKTNGYRSQNNGKDVNSSIPKEDIIDAEFEELDENKKGG